MKRIARAQLIAALLGVAAPVFAVDRLDLEGTEIKGNRELPKVLYIVPWKKPLPGDLVGRPVESLLDEALAPLDRDVFRRQIQYYRMMREPGAPPIKK